MSQGSTISSSGAGFAGEDNFSFDEIIEYKLIPIHQQMIVYQKIEIGSDLHIDGKLVIID